MMHDAKALKPRKLNSKGLGVVDLLLASAFFLSALVGVMGMVDVSSKSARTSALHLDRITLIKTIATLVGSSPACTKALGPGSGTPPFDPTQPPPGNQISIPSLSIGSTVIAQLNQPAVGVKVTQMTLTQATGTTANLIPIIIGGVPTVENHIMANLHVEVVYSGPLSLLQNIPFATDYPLEIYTDSSNIIQRCENGTPDPTYLECDPTTVSPAPIVTATTFECQVYCPPYQQMIGGGCAAGDDTWEVTSSTPLVNGWDCKVAQGAGWGPLTVSGVPGIGYAVCL